MWEGGKGNEGRESKGDGRGDRRGDGRMWNEESDLIGQT